MGGQENADLSFEHDEDNPDLNCNEKLMNFFIINIYLHFRQKPSYTFCGFRRGKLLALLLLLHPLQYRECQHMQL